MPLAAVALVLTVSALAGCDDDPEPAKRTSPSPSPSRSLAVPSSSGELGAVCTGKVYPDSPPFAGERPHPIRIVGLDKAKQQWAPAGDAADKYQLVACATPVAGPVVDDCVYRGAGGTTTRTLVRGDVEFRLVEIRTGREVAKVPATGLASPKCETVVFGTGDTQVGPPDDDAIALALAPYFSQ